MKIFVDIIWILDENVGMESVVSSLYDNLTEIYGQGRPIRKGGRASTIGRH